MMSLDHVLRGGEDDVNPRKTQDRQPAGVVVVNLDPVAYPGADKSTQSAKSSQPTPGRPMDSDSTSAVPKPAKGRRPDPRPRFARSRTDRSPEGETAHVLLPPGRAVRGWLCRVFSREWTDPSVTGHQHNSGQSQLADDHGNRRGPPSRFWSNGGSLMRDRVEASSALIVSKSAVSSL